MNLNEWDDLMGLNEYRSEAGRAFYGLRNEVDEAELPMLYPHDFDGLSQEQIDEISQGYNLIANPYPELHDEGGES